MDLREWTRGGPWISIGLKIFTIAALVLALMCAVTVLTVHMAANVNRDLKVLGHGYVASYAALARVNIRSVERALHIRRMYINARDGQGWTPTAELQRLAEEADAGARRELADARRFVREEMAQAGSSIRDIAALSRIDTLLEVIGEERDRLADRQRAFVAALLASTEPESLRPRLAELDAAREDHDRRIEGARRELYQAVAAAADAAQAEQANVVRAVVIITTLAGLLGLLVAAGFSRGLSRPVRRLLEGTQAVQRGELDTVVPVTSRDEIGLLTRAFNDMVAELKVKTRIKETFGKYIDPRIVQGLIERPELATTAAGERRVMTVLFCDMEGSSALGEWTTPAGLVAIINRYFTEMSEPIHRHGGVIDKYIGDAIMAFWGPPFVAAEAQAELACLSALDQLARLPDLTASLPELVGVRQGLPPVAVRVGIATGEVLVGDIGSAAAKSYTVMGDTVNLASRLEGANKLYGTRVLVGERTARLAGTSVELREIDSAQLAGRGEPERVFEVLGRAGEVDAATLELRDRYAEGLAAYRRGAWAEARAAFAACLDLRPDDRPTVLFLERLDAPLAAPPAGEPRHSTPRPAVAAE
jgi:class 3 adenylate cyclase/cell division protein ZapA (FtsZ GTPase activity inhibitor)